LGYFFFLDLGGKSSSSSSKSGASQCNMNSSIAAATNSGGKLFRDLLTLPYSCSDDQLK